MSAAWFVDFDCYCFESLHCGFAYLTSDVEFVAYVFKAEGTSRERFVNVARVA